MEIISPLPIGKFIRIKRKALESVEDSWLKQKEIKRCKFIGTSSSGSVDALKDLIKGKTPALASPEDFEVIDYDVFVNEVNHCGQLPKVKEGKSHKNTNIFFETSHFHKQSEFR